MDNNLPLHIKNFNTKVRAMNQTGSRLLTMNAEEARSLHAEIFDLLATISNFTQNESADQVVTVVMDGGTFK
jgi:hypothetical protein